MQAVELEFVCSGIEAPPSDPNAPAAKAVVQYVAEPKGEVHALVIFAKFKNEIPDQNSAPAYADDLFDPNRPGSLTHFFDTMSFGQYQLTGKVVPKRYSSRRRASYYTKATDSGIGGYGAFVVDILKQVDRDVDFRRFDNDGPDGYPDSGDDDGVVDYLFVNVHSAPYGFLYRAATGISDIGESYVSRDAGHLGNIEVIRRQGAVQQEGTFSQTVGVMAHEYGHRFRLPDLYDYSYDNPAEDSAGIGKWGLMGWGAHGWSGKDGPNPFSAWSLEQLGWIGRDNSRLLVVDKDREGIEVRHLLDNGNVVKIPLRSRGPVGEEYLLLEQRRRKASHYDRKIPGEGLLVWHVKSAYRSNAREEDKMLDLVSADGLFADSGYPVGARAEGTFGMDNLDFWAHDANYRRSHSGNMGDATDPFDGIRHTSLNTNSNPSNNPGGTTSSASSGPALTMRRGSDGTVIDVRMPRWAGRIDDGVFWFGSVYVDGDITVDKGGMLTIDQGTRVRVAGFDVLRSGVDEERVELDIRGGFRIHGKITDGKVPESVVMSSAVPGGDWFGVTLNTDSRVDIPHGSLVVRDDQPNSMPMARDDDSIPAMVRSYRILNELGLEVHGDGGGESAPYRVSPGESFHLEVGLRQAWKIEEKANWRPSNGSTAEIEVHWSSPHMASTWGEDLSLDGVLAISRRYTLRPGFVQATEMPSLSIRSEAPVGHEFDVLLRVVEKSGRRVWLDTLRFVVEPQDPDAYAEWDLSDFLDPGATMAVVPTKGATVRTTVPEGVVGADLIIRRGKDLEPVVERPMQQDEGSDRVFAATMNLPDIDLYRLFLRFRRADGSSVYAKNSMFVWPGRERVGPAALVFVGDHYNEDEISSIRNTITAGLNSRDLLPHEPEVAGADATIYRDLLPHYLHPGDVVIWVGETLNREARAEFESFLDAGGRLMIISSVLKESAGIEEFLRERLHAVSGDRNNRLTKVREFGLNRDVCCLGRDRIFRADEVEPIPPARFAMSDMAGGGVGVRLAKEGYRTVYLPMEWPSRSADRANLSYAIDIALSYLQEDPRWGALREVVLDVAEYEAIGNHKSVVFDRSIPMRLTTNARVRKAELFALSRTRLESGKTKLLNISDAVRMRRAGQEDGRYFYEADYAPPGPDVYVFSVILHPMQGDPFVPPATVRVHALLPSEPTETLLFVSEGFHEKQRAPIVAQVTDWMSDRGLRTSTLLGRGDEEDALFLERHLADKKAVVWIGAIDYWQQKKLRRFLLNGGRLLLVTPDIESAPNGGASGLFLMLHETLTEGRPRQLGKIVEGLPDEHTFTGRLVSRPVIPTRPAIPLLLSGDGDAVASYLDAGNYRAIHLSFRLNQLGNSTRSFMIQHYLEMLAPEVDTNVESVADLGIEGLQPVEVIEVGSRMTPLLLRNGGGAEATDVRVSYEVSGGGREVSTGEIAGPALSAFSFEEFALPPEALAAEGAYYVKVKIAEFGGEWSEEVSGQVVVLDLPDPFEPADIGGEINKGNGSVLFDYDGDGDLDAYLVRLGAPSVMLQNERGVLHGNETLALDIGTKGRGVVVGDYDGDGDLDLYAITEETNHLFRNEGAGQFFEVTEEASARATGDSTASVSLADDEGAGRSGGFFDWDLDGDLDLYLVNHWGENHLFENESGRFSDRAIALGVADTGNGRGLAICDYDGDLDPDLFVANNSGDSKLLRNQGSGFEDVTEAVGLSAAPGDVSAVFGDYDNDGDFDLLVANERASNRLYRNESESGDPVAFTEVTSDSVALSGRSVGVALLDYDNDGDLDLFTAGVSTRVDEELFHNINGRLVGAAHLLGLKRPSSCRGLSFGDIDEDGDLDLFVAAFDSTRLFLNSGGSGSELWVDLAASGMNRHGIGARVEVVTGDKRQLRQVQSALGYCSQIQPRVHFGVGGIVDTVRVTWPDGALSIATDIWLQKQITFVHPAPRPMAMAASGLPDAFGLFANLPNPFNSGTTIYYDLPQLAPVILTIYNVAGQVVDRLVDEVQSAGRYQVYWDGKSPIRGSVGSGIYFYRLQAGDYLQARRLVLIR